MGETTAIQQLNDERICLQQSKEYTGILNMWIILLALNWYELQYNISINSMRSFAALE